jgi:hypothetical protein
MSSSTTNTIGLAADAPDVRGGIPFVVGIAIMPHLLAFSPPCQESIASEACIGIPRTGNVPLP